MIKTVLIAPLILLFFSCASTAESIENQQGQPMTKMDLEPNVYNCQLIEKTVVNKGGKMTEIKELYLRCSTQDYFIKLCSSNVTRDELMPYLNHGISVEVEIKDGMWDHCSDDPAYAQSRMGTYAIIKKIND